MSIKIICAWCGKDLGTKEGESGGTISHGICPECVRAEIMKIQGIDRQRPLQEATA